MTITEGQILNMVNEFEKRVQARDASFSCRVQSAKGLHGVVYLVHVENATEHSLYTVDSATHEWIRVINVPD